MRRRALVVEGGCLKTRLNRLVDFPLAVVGEGNLHEDGHLAVVDRRRGTRCLQIGELILTERPLGPFRQPGATLATEFVDIRVLGPALAAEHGDLLCRQPGRSLGAPCTERQRANADPTAPRRLAFRPRRSTAIPGTDYIARCNLASRRARAFPIIRSA